MKKARTSTSILLLIGSVPALAQVEAPARPEVADASSGLIPDIVVTAEKRARGESIQKTPLAITAINAATMQKAQLITITDVGRLAPSVTLNDAGSSPGFANFFIRGIGVQGSLRTIDPAVSLVVDGMVQEFQQGNTLDTFDIQSVEVLRGPQGILFGRNATGGAVVFTTRRPTDKLEIEGQVRVGSGDRHDFAGLIAGPLAGDKILGKIAVIFRNSDGLYSDKNRGTFVPAPYNPSGTDPSGTGRQLGEKTWIVHPTLVLKPTDDIQVSLLGEYTHSETGAGIARLLNDVPNLQTYFGYTPVHKRTDYNHDDPGKARQEVYRGIVEATWDIGAGVFTSVTGYRHVAYDYQFDTDGTPFVLLEFPKGSFDRSGQISEEFRFASDFSDFVTLVAGGYYSHLKMHGTELRIQSPFFGGGAANAPLRYIRGTYDQDSNSLAGFYDIDIHPLSGLRLSHGGRFTRDHKDFGVIPLQVCAMPNFVGCATKVFNGRHTWNNYSPKFNVDYQLASKLLLYASWTKGYRSGNYNQRPPIAAPTTPANPEEVRTIEGGVKTTFWSGRARVNITGFTSKYNDIQRAVTINAIQQLTNAGSATINGVELESSVIPFDGLELTGNVGYLDAHYDQFLNLDVNGGGYDPSVDPGLAKKLKFEQVAKWTTYVAANYSFHVAGIAPEMVARASYAYRGPAYGDTLNQAYIGNSQIVDASFTVQTDKWHVTAFAKNLLNDENGGIATRHADGPGAAALSFAVVTYGGSPREFGLEFGVKF